MNRQLFRYHPDIGYTFIPGLKTRVEHESGGYLIRTNQLGFRSDREFIREKTGDQFRVLVFGDSFTAADGVSNRYRYTDQLEAMVPELEVFNFGLSGTGTDQQYLVYEQFASEIECDLIVISVLVENIRRVAARYRTYSGANGEKLVYAKPFFSLDEHGALVRHHTPVPKDAIPESDLPATESKHVDRGGGLAWLRTAVNRLGTPVKDVVQRVTRFQPLPMYESPDNCDWLLMKTILKEWISSIRVPVIVCPLPIYQHVEETSSASAYQTRFQELKNEMNVTIHDPLPDYHRTPKSERRDFRFATDIHPTRSSHNLLANSLQKSILPLIETVKTQRASNQQAA